MINVFANFEQPFKKRLLRATTALQRNEGNYLFLYTDKT